MVEAGRGVGDGGSHCCHNGRPIFPQCAAWSRRRGRYHSLITHLSYSALSTRCVLVTTYFFTGSPFPLPPPCFSYPLVVSSAPSRTSLRPPLASARPAARRTQQVHPHRQVATTVVSRGRAGLGGWEARSFPLTAPHWPPGATPIGLPPRGYSGEGGGVPSGRLLDGFTLL